MGKFCYNVPRMTWIIVGLGNPGEEYTGTRHNTGRMAVEQFAKDNDFSAWKADFKDESDPRERYRREKSCCARLA